jgi:hypothetical protein
MLIANFVLLAISIIVLSILYQKYLDKKSRMIDLNNYSDIQQYLLKDTRYLLESDKPILWIHIPYEYNSRQWLDFGSRSSEDLNQPYLYLTVQSIIKNCENSFKIVLVDDQTFEKIIPNWSIDLKTVPEPTKGYIRQMALAKLIYIYGGINVPISFLCFRDLISLYENGTRHDNMFVCENFNNKVNMSRSIGPEKSLFYPNCEFFGANEENETVHEFINFMELSISGDYTNEITFDDTFNEWCMIKINNNKINMIDGTLTGIKTVENDPVNIETLLSDNNQYIHFYSKTYGIWIPAQDLLNRVHYNWFVRLSTEQIIESQFILAKYFVLAMAPDSYMGVIEPLKTETNWIDFWRVPLTNNTLNIFGPKPIYLGNNISRGKPINN